MKRKYANQTVPAYAAAITAMLSYILLRPALSRLCVLAGNPAWAVCIAKTVRLGIPMLILWPYRKSEDGDGRSVYASVGVALFVMAIGRLLGIALYGIGEADGIGRFEILSVLVLSPILEEGLFRALWYRCVRQFAAPLWAYIISVGFFAVCHGWSGSLFYVILCGMALQYCYVKTKKLFPCIALHTLMNLSSLVYILLSIPREWQMGADGVLAVLGILWFLIQRKREAHED